jgi:Hypervirulence associated proteins TUDOR domain
MWLRMSPGVDTSTIWRANPPFRRRADQDGAMTKTFKVGDHVSWNSEAGRVRGKIVKVHRRDVNYKGHVHHATSDEPQYEIKSDKTDHIALHKAAVLRLLG